MANTYTLIQAQTLASSAASVTFSSIPATFTDLLLRISARNTSTGGDCVITFNGSASSYTNKILTGNGTAASSTAGSITGLDSELVPSSYTASTFSNSDVYIPNYLSTSNSKSVSIDTVSENNAATAYADFIAGLWAATPAAITSITCTPNANNFAQYSTFYLYGIKNS